ncbi:septin-7-like, partial [Sander lucioperca]|uniref:septin-7-like n=1 Tax=Sander lucioperca TaxID=283035 RepID=UPI00125D2742
MATNTSSRYDNITCKVLIQSGSPAVYQLIPKKEKIGSLTRMTLGEKDPNKKNKTILLVGETGTGKSTLINALVNYAMGVEWEDDVWFQIVEEEKRSQSESQTSDVIVYQIFGFEDNPLPYSLTIIDTPGYGDTRGIEHDDIISQRLLDLFQSEDGVDEINAVGLVMTASENRLNDRLKYIFNSVISLFGKDLEKNIVALITHSDGRTPKNVLKALGDANIKCAKNKDGEPVHFMFNNHQSREKTKKNKDALKGAWEVTMTHMGEFADFLIKQSPQTLKTTVEVLHLQIRLTACINNLQDRIKEIELKQEEIQQTQAGLKKHEEEMKNNENFTIEVDEVYKVCSDE